MRTEKEVQQLEEYYACELNTSNHGECDTEIAYAYTEGFHNALKWMLGDFEETHELYKGNNIE